MSPDDFLIRHAYKNVWCAPGQDNQFIIQPARLTPAIGVRGTTGLIWNNINLPKPGIWYHLYQIGNIMPKQFGMTISTRVWTNAAHLMVNDKMFIDVYFDNGRMIPRDRVFFLRTRDGNLAIAVQDTKSIGNQAQSPLYFRFYSNAYFSRTDESSPSAIGYDSGVITNESVASTLYRKWRDMKELPGKSFAYVNGWRVQELNSLHSKTGDLVEMVRDSSVKATYRFKISDLPTFTSDLDEVLKYLLHHEGTDPETIDYRDDIDFYLLKMTNANQGKGVYYHKNKENAVRMVTHRDYSIPAAYVDMYTANNPGWGLVPELTVELNVRHSGLIRPLIDEAHHIRELYKLPHDEIVRAMVGTEATVSVWKVAELEKSKYPALMRAVQGTITRKMVEDAYGYNAVTKLVADTPQLRPFTDNWIELPVLLMTGSTIFEYDSIGHLLGWYSNEYSMRYIPKNPGCAYVEGIIGKGSDQLNTTYGAGAIIPEGVNYRCYVCGYLGDKPDGVWKDVTGESEYYEVTDGRVMWNTDPTRYYTAIKYDDQFLVYNLDLDYQDALLRFTINIKEVRIDGQLYTGLYEIPPGMIELWLNGASLIEGLDWFMHGREIAIVSKRFRNPTGSQRITIRCTGFSDKDLNRTGFAEFGYVNRGYLSANNRYNLRDDKVIRITAGGRLKHRSELTFSEDHTGVVITDVPNGTPYQVIHPIIPLPGILESDLYVMRDLAIQTDREVENYMTEKYPEPPIPVPNMIPTRYPLYSPFLAKIMYDMIHGYIPVEPISGHYGDMVVLAICKPYEWLLEYEPTRKDLDWEYVRVDPHERNEIIEIDYPFYTFLRRVIRVYLDDKVAMNEMIAIKDPETAIP